MYLGEDFHFRKFVERKYMAKKADKLTLEEAKALFYFASIHLTLKINISELIEKFDDEPSVWLDMLSQPEYVGLAVINSKDNVKEYLKDDTHKIPNITLGFNTSIQSR